jgi:hypothetical protein
MEAIGNAYKIEMEILKQSDLLENPSGVEEIILECTIC